MNLDCFTGSTNQIELSRRNFSSLELLLPPLAEQRKIAEILGSVDEAIAATQAVIDQTRRVKQGLLQQLLTRGIGHTRFKQTEIGEIPESWEVVELEKLTECITKGESPRWQGFEYQQEGILFVTSENVRDRFLDLENPKFIPAEFGEKLRRSRLVSGDVLVNIVGASIGRASLYERNDVANVNQAVAVVRPIRAKVLPRLLLEAIYATRGQAYLGLNQVESARPNVSLTSLRNFPMIVPPITEQQKIVEIAEGVDAVIEAGTEKLHQFHRLKSGLMSDLLTGRVRVKVSA
jgi:type I restriction enzyme S subunit